jgi:hypothetical protein
MSLPLEFRGSDAVCAWCYWLDKFSCFLQNLRRNMETVIEGLMGAPDQTIKRKHDTMPFGILLNPSTN